MANGSIFLKDDRNHGTAGLCVENFPRPGSMLSCVRGLMVLILGFWFITGSISIGQENAAPAAPSPPDPKISSLETAIKAHAQRMAAPHFTPPPPANHDDLLIGVAVLLVGGLAFRVTISLLSRRLNRPIPSKAKVNNSPESVLAENPSVAAFFGTLGSEPAAPAPPTAPNEFMVVNLLPQTADETDSGIDRVQEFLKFWPALLGRLRKFSSEINSSCGEVECRQKLLAVMHQVEFAKGACPGPRLIPVWQMAFALGNLLKALSAKRANVTPSAMKTVAGAIDVLDALATCGNLNPALATHPPARILAVDDDPVCRNAISLALKKAFNPPELAENGDAALALLARQTYDLIFLDVEMPGMDGFTLCSKIQASDLHRDTPAVFVTRHSDFDSREKSRRSGGRDLIAKPYLPLEITVKALSVLLLSRLGSGRPDVSSGPALIPRPARPEPAMAAVL